MTPRHPNPLEQWERVGLPPAVAPRYRDRKPPPLRPWLGYKEHLSWLLESFVYADLAAMSPGHRAALRSALIRESSLLNEGPWEVDENDAEDLAIVQDRAREIVEHFAAGDGHYELQFGEGEPHGGIVRPLRIVSARVCGLPPNEHIYVPLADALSIGLLYAHIYVSFSELRRCPYRGADGQECGRVFVAVRAQKWCRPHGEERRREQNRAALAKHRAKAKKPKGRRR